MIVQHNMQSANANRMLGIVNTASSKSTEKLSSGYRINRAADDAAGLSISEKMRAQVRGLNQASRNAEDGISLIQTAEGALNETHSILQRIRELAVESANDTYKTEDREKIQSEVDQLKEEIDRIASTTQFNKMNLLDGSFSGKNFQVGANSSQLIGLTISNAKASAIGLSGGALSVKTASDATTAIDMINEAITKVSKIRGDLGAKQNRLEHTVDNLNNISENMQASESRVRDTDMASEMVNYSKNNIIQQAAQSMLAQANQANQGVLTLLR